MFSIAPHGQNPQPRRPETVYLERMLRAPLKICYLAIVGVTLLEPACGTDPSAVPAVHFAMYYGGTYDQAPFDAAWSAARSNPEQGLAYTFPLVTTDIAPGTQIRLLAGRSTNDPAGPSTTADDVIILDERWVATTTVGDDEKAELPALTVATGAWSSESNAIPVELLCGTTVIAARAFESGADAQSFRFLAATFMTTVTPPCP